MGCLRYAPNGIASNSAMKNSFIGSIPKYVIIIGCFAFIARLVFVIYYKDLSDEFYWEYGEIAKNIKAGNGYALHHFEENKLSFWFKPGVKPHASAYMPPGYVYFILPLLYIEQVEIRNIIIFCINSILHFIALLYLYKLTKLFFSDKAAVITIIIYAFLPEFIYSAATYGTTPIYHLAIVALLYYLLIADENSQNSKIILIIAAILAILTLFRQEILLFTIMISIYYFLKRQYKSVFIIISISIITLIPWQVRNYSVFGEYVPLSTSGGVNFYRGHNPYEPDCWGDDKLYSELNKYKDSSNFELYMSKVFYDFAFAAIRENPVRELRFTFEKLYNLWIVNPKYPRANHVLYLVPWLVILPLSLFGLWKSRSPEKYKYFYMFFIYSSLLAILFFALPRYQTMMKIALVPFAGYALSVFIEYIISLRKKSKFKN